MIRVLYVGNVSDDDLSPPHSTENHVKQALRNMGHVCVPIQEKGLDWSTLPDLVDRVQPNLFLWTRTAGFDPADLEGQANAIKKLGIPTVGFHLDRWWGLNRQPDIHRSPFFRLDHVFTADGGHQSEWSDVGVNHYWSPPAILSDEAKRVGNYRQDYTADIGFVGNLRNYGHPEWGPYRRQLYRFLALTYKGRFRLWEGGIRGQDLADLYTSVKVLIGDSCLAGDVTHYWSDRIPETCGRGGFLIHPYVEGLKDAYPQLVPYPLGDFDRLGYLIDFWLGAVMDDERRELAAAARVHVLAHHTYEHRMERVLATTLR